MTKYAYVNGELSPIEEASVPLRDRGFLFGDGVYDVARLLEGEAVWLDRHVERLQRNARELGFDRVPSSETWREAVDAVVDESDLDEGMVYMQATRGAGPRQASFPEDVDPTVVVYVDEVGRDLERRRREGASVVLVPEIRWDRCDVKSVNLLPKVLMRQEAERRGAYEALFTSESGSVWEGASSNVFVVDGGTLRTSEHPRRILPGLTRRKIFDIAADREIPVETGEVTVDDLYAADELFLTGTLTGVLGVVEVDGETVAGGEPGETTRELHRELVERRRRSVNVE